MLNHLDDQYWQSLLTNNLVEFITFKHSQETIMIDPTTCKYIKICQNGQITAGQYGKNFVNMAQIRANTNEGGFSRTLLNKEQKDLFDAKYNELRGL